MGAADGGQHTGGGAEGRFDGGVHVAAEDDGAAHIHRHRVAALGNGQEALQEQGLAAIAGGRALQGAVQAVGVLTAQGQGQHLRHQQLAQVALPFAARDEQSADEQRPATGALPHQRRQGWIAQPGEQVLAVQTAVGRSAQHRAVRVPADHHIVAAALQKLRQALRRGAGQHGTQEGGGLPDVSGDEGQVLRPQHGLVLGLAEVQALTVDELLHRGVDEVGHVAVGIHRLANAGGADLLQLGRQRQLHHVPGNAGIVGLHRVRLGAAEDNVVEGVDGIRLGRLLVGRGVDHHVAAHHDGHAAPRERLAQLAQVLRVGDVHREVLREDVNVELVRHGHGYDAAADAVGLGALGPGKFVDGQQHLEAQVADGPDDALVGQGEGVKRAGEEGHGPRWAEVEPAVEQPLLGEEAVQLAQHERPVVERQLPVGGLVVGGQQLPLRQQKGAALLVAAQLVRAEHVAAQHEHSLLAGGVVDAAQAAHQHTQQPLTAAAVGLVRLRETGAVDIVLLVDHAHRVQHGGGDAAVGGAEVHMEVVQHLIQLRRRQPQGEAAQVVGDIFGELLLAQLQPPAQLHRHLVALVGGEPGRKLQQGAAGAVAHRHPVADLDEVGQVGGDVQSGAFAAAGKVGEQAQVGLLGDPGGSGLQVVQEYLGHHVIRQQQRRAAGQQVIAQPAQRGAVGAVHGGDGLQRAGQRRVQPVQAVQQQHGGQPHRQVAPAAHGHGEGTQLTGVGGGQGAVRQGGGGVEKLKGYGVLRVLRAAVVGKDRGEEALLPPGGVVQQGNDGEFQGVADPAPVLGHQLVVGVEHLVQIQLPLLHIGGRAGVGTAVRGALLGVARVEAGDDLAQQRRRLAADVALAVHQQLIEERQRLHLLRDVEIERVAFEYAEVGAQTPPVRLAAGQLQKPGEAPLAGEAGHQLHVVRHAAHGQGVERLVIGHQRGVLLRQGGGVAALQRHVHAPVDHVALEVLQAGVNTGVALLFHAVHVVQLGQDHLERLVQGRDAGDLPALAVVDLLHAEVGVDQQQRLHGQVVRLQIPHGVVGGDVADVSHAAASEPQVGVVIVQIGHALAGPASEFPDVVAGGSAGHQRQIHRRAAAAQGTGRRQCHVVYPGDVLQRAEGRYLQPQAHQLVDVLPLPLAQKFGVGRGAGAVRQLRLREEIKGVGRVVGQQLALGGEQHLQDRQKEHRAGGAGLVLLPLRVQKPPGEVVAVRQPALLRPDRAQDVQLRAAQGQHIGAAQPRAVEQRREPLHIAVALRPGQQLLPPRQPVGGAAVGQPAAQGQVHLPDTLLVHGAYLRFRVAGTALPGESIVDTL